MNEGFMSNLTPIALVGSNAELNAQIQSILAVYFEVKLYTDTVLALEILQQEPHYALIVDNNVKPTGGLPFWKAPKKYQASTLFLRF